MNEDSDAVGQGVEWWDVLRELRARPWTVGLIMAVALGLGVWWGAGARKLYVSQATLLVEGEGQRVVSGAEVAAVSEEVLKTLEQSLVNPALALRVVERAGGVGDPGFSVDARGPVSVQGLADGLQGRMNARVRRGTSMIDVRVGDERPAMARKLAGLWVEQFLESSAEGRVEVSRKAYEFLHEEAGRLKRSLTQAEEALQSYREVHETVSLEERQNMAVERLRELNTKVASAKAERLRLEGDRGQVERMRARRPEELLSLGSIARSEEVAALRNRLSEKESLLAGLSGRYRPGHPKYQQLAGEVAEWRQALGKAVEKAMATVDTAWQGAVATERSLEQAVRSQETIALELGAIGIPYQELLRNLNAERVLYEAVLGRLKQADVGQGVSRFAVRLVVPASLPVRPEQGRGLMALLVSVIAGGVVAVLWVMVPNYLGDALHRGSQLERCSRLPLLSAVPEASGEGAGAEVMVEEAFRALRMGLSLGEAGRARVLVFTSALPGEGKTFCAVRYAMALAGQGLRTLLVDADLRAPALAARLGVDAGGGGLGACLQGDVAWGRVVRSTQVEGLEVLPAGRGCGVDVLREKPLRALLSELAGRYDRVVVDAAPVRVASETLLVASLGDAVCFVVRAGKTRRADVTGALERLRQCGCVLAGVVLNRAADVQRGYDVRYYGAREGAGGLGEETAAVAREGLGL